MGNKHPEFYPRVPQQQNKPDPLASTPVSVKVIDENRLDTIQVSLFEDLSELPDTELKLHLEKKTKKVLNENDGKMEQEDENEPNAQTIVPKPRPPPESNKWFKVQRKEVRDERTGKLVNIETEIEVKDPTLQSYLTSYGVMLNYEQYMDIIFVKTRATCPVERLFIMYDQFQQYYPSSTNEFKKLMDWLEEEYKRARQKAEKLISKGKISFDTLWYLFTQNGKFFSNIQRDLIVGAKIIQRRYVVGLGETFEITGKSIKSNGQSLFEYQQTYNIYSFRGVMDILALRQQPMTEDMMKVLNRRGEMFKQVALGHHFKQYEGYLVINRGWGSTLYKADGRVMVDLSTFDRMNPDYGVFKNPNGVNNAVNLSHNMGYDNNFYGQQNTGVVARLADDSLFMTWPTVAGFSFACKRWGEVVVSNLTDIVFDDLAFERLVMPEQKKMLVQALVEQHQKTKERKTGFTDIITGKGGGCIFLLHGPPGTGKTLTAESVAEHLHHPLYSVTVGELGTTTKDLESKLQEILEMASIWNACILIDEADIFLEKRTDYDITRNAMVGIFLRLLEYHQGVLFLTTNRVRCFDEAFHSRISVALKYDDLDEKARQKVWNNFFEAAKIKNIDPRDLAVNVLNGRQIRNVIQLSQALAAREGVEVTLPHIQRTLHVAMQFENNLSWETDEMKPLENKQEQMDN